MLKQNEYNIISLNKMEIYTVRLILRMWKQAKWKFIWKKSTYMIILDYSEVSQTQRW